MKIHMAKETGEGNLAIAREAAAPLHAVGLVGIQKQCRLIGRENMMTALSPVEEEGSKY